MARTTRLEFDGALYLDRIEHYRERYRWIVYAYVLMSDHVHLLIETGAVGLSKIMQGIQFSYSQRYNRGYRAVGHDLFKPELPRIVIIAAIGRLADGAALN